MDWTKCANAGAVEVRERAGGGDEGLAESAVERDGVHSLHHQIGGLALISVISALARIHLGDFVIGELGVMTTSATSSTASGRPVFRQSTV